MGNVFNDPDSKVYGARMGASGADRTQVGPMLAPWTMLSGSTYTISVSIDGRKCTQRCTGNNNNRVYCKYVFNERWHACKCILDSAVQIRNLKMNNFQIIWYLTVFKYLCWGRLHTKSTMNSSSPFNGQIMLHNNHNCRGERPMERAFGPLDGKYFHIVLLFWSTVRWSTLF